MKNEIDKTVERIEQLPDGRHLIPCDHLDCEIDGGLDTDGVKKLVAAYTKLKADLATAKQGLEHYADENSWDYSRFIHDGMDDAQIAALPKDLYIWDDANGQDLAQQTLDKIGKE